MALQKLQEAAAAILNFCRMSFDDVIDFWVFFVHSYLKIN